MKMHMRYGVIEAFPGQPREKELYSRGIAGIGKHWTRNVAGTAPHLHKWLKERAR